MKILPHILVLALFACTKNSQAPDPVPTPPDPKPTIHVVASPSANVIHGDTVEISYTTTNANGASGTIKLRPIRDTVIYRTITTAAGQASDSVKLIVTIPSETSFLVNGVWKLYALRLQNASGVWIPYSLNHCDSVSARLFTINFKETNTSDVGCMPPTGVGVADWFWKAGVIGKRDSISWGANLYGVLSLTATEFVLRKNVINIPGPGTTLCEWTYKH